MSNSKWRISRSAKGRQARKYFIEIEKMWNSPEMIMKRALELANKKVEHLQLVTSKQKQLTWFKITIEPFYFMDKFPIL